MSLPDPENTRIDHPIEDSGIHIRDTERAPASLWQMTIAALLVITILVIFFYGLTSQREEVAGVQPPAPTITNPSGQLNVSEQAQKPKAPATTTGQAAK